MYTRCYLCYSLVSVMVHIMRQQICRFRWLQTVPIMRHTGQYVPGIMGTLFSLVDKLVSSLGSTIVGAAVAMIGIQTLPDSKTPYSSGMHGVVLILFCIVPMIAWLATLWAMKGARMKEIQAVNAVRKHAVSEGTSLEEAMEKWKTYEDVPEEFK